MSFRERLKKADKPSNWWKPEPGTMLIGELIEVKAHTGQFGEQTIYLVKNDEDGSIVTVPGWTVLKSAIEEQGIKPGDRLGIKFLEDRGNYKDFVVLKDDESGADGS